MPDLLGFYLTQTWTSAWASLLVAACFIVPGLVPALALARRLRLQADETLLAAFSITTALAGVSALVCYYLRLPLWAAAAITLAAATGLGWRFRDSLRFRPRIEPAPGLWLALAAWAVSLAEGTWFGFASDAFYHVAAVRTLVDRGLPVVTDPLYGTSTRVLDIATGAWHSMLAMISLATRVPADALWGGLSPFVTAMLVLGFCALARKISGCTWAAAVATGVWAVSALLLDFRLLVMPQTGALVFVFAMMLGLLLLADDPSRPAMWLAVTGGVAAVLTHLGVGELALLVLGVACATTLLLARTELRSAGIPWLRAATPVLQTAATVSAIVAMPLAQRLWAVAHSWVVALQPSYLHEYAVVVPVLGVMPQLAWAPGTAARWYGWPLIAAAVMLTLAIDVLLAGMVLDAWRTRDLRQIMAAGFAGFAFLLLRLPLLSWLLSILAAYMTVRLLLLVAFSPYLVLAWALAQARDTSSGGGRWHLWLRPVAIGACVFAVATAVPGVSATFVDRPATLRRGQGASIPVMWKRDARYEWGSGALARVRAEFGTRYPMVAADLITGYELAAVEPMAVIAVPGPHSPFFMETASKQGQRRRSDMARLMRPAASETLRRALLEKYRPEYMAISSETPHYLAALLSLRHQPNLFEPVVVTTRLALFRVKY